MFQISNHDETFLILNDAMTRICHSRKRDRIYLKQLSYLRNFLNLLHIYRVYLAKNRRKNALEWHRRNPIASRQSVIVKWHRGICRGEMYTTAVIFRFFHCQLTVTRVDNATSLLLFGVEFEEDKKIRILFGREKIRKILSVVCERVGIYKEFVGKELCRK